MLSRITIILALNVLLYAKTLLLGYVSDDIPTFKNPPKMTYRWSKIYYWLIAQYKSCPKWDHLLTLVFHALISVFIYLAFGRNQVSFIAALLFTCNPANNQVSVWISGRGYAIPSLMLLMALTIPFLGPVALWCGAFFNVGFLAPLALIGSSKFYLLVFMPFIWWCWWKRFRFNVVLKASNEEVVEDQKIHFKKIILAIKTVGFYLTLGLIPFKISFYHSFLQSCAGNEIMKKRAYSLCKFFWIGLSAIIFFVVYSLHRWDTISYGLFWFFIAIAPFSNFRRVQQEIAERYLYLPNIGLMLVLGSLVAHNPVLIAIFLTMYITKLSIVFRMYTDDYWLVESAVYEDPAAWYAWHMRGFKRWDVKSYHEALTMWVMAKLLDPKEFKVLFNIAIVLRLLKQDAESDAYLKAAEENIIEGQEKEARYLIDEFRKGRAHLQL
jgi:hypothetical protein